MQEREIRNPPKLNYDQAQSNMSHQPRNGMGFLHTWTLTDLYQYIHIRIQRHYVTPTSTQVSVLKQHTNPTYTCTVTCISLYDIQTAKHVVLFQEKNTISSLTQQKRPTTTGIHTTGCRQHITREPQMSFLRYLTSKMELWGAGAVICLERDANDSHMVQLIPLPSSSLASLKSRMV